MTITWRQQRSCDANLNVACQKSANWQYRNRLPPEIYRKTYNIAIFKNECWVLLGNISFLSQNVCIYYKIQPRTASASQARIEAACHWANSRVVSSTLQIDVILIPLTFSIKVTVITKSLIGIRFVGHGKNTYSIL